MVSIVGVCRASRGLIQAFASLFHCRPCRFHGHRTSGQATFVATFSRLLAIFCTFRTFCPTRCFVDKILRVYMCQTIYVYIYLASDPTTVKLFRVFQSSYERTVMLCSSNIDFKGSYCFYYSRFTSYEYRARRRTTRYKISALFDEETKHVVT